MVEKDLLTKEAVDFVGWMEKNNVLRLSGMNVYIISTDLISKQYTREI